MCKALWTEQTDKFDNFVKIWEHVREQTSYLEWDEKTILLNFLEKNLQIEVLWSFKTTTLVHIPSFNSQKWNFPNYVCILQDTSLITSINMQCMRK